MNKYILKIGSIYFIMLWLFSACQRDESIDDGGGSQSDKKVRLEMFTRAYSYNIPTLRSSADETGIDMTPWVLVFKGSDENATFVEAVQAVEFSGINKRYVILTQQAGSCQLLILANPKNNFYSGGVAYQYTAANFETCLNGKKLSEATKLLLTEPLNDPQTTIPYVSNEKLPMSYLHPVSSIDENTQIGTSGSLLELTRAVAKVTIKNEDSTFKLTGIVTVMNAPRQGYLHRLTSDVPLDNDSQPLVEYFKNDGYTTDLITVGSSQTTEDDPIYLYESKSGTTDNDLYIIVKGEYAGNEYFYKIFLADSNMLPLDILRNHYYLFTIKSINGRGYDNVEDAKLSRASNVYVDIMITDETSFEIVSNNDYYMGLTNSVFIAYTNSVDDATDITYTLFSVTTDCDIEFLQANRSITHNDTGWNINIQHPAPDKGGPGQIAIIPVVTSSTTNPVITEVKSEVRNYLGKDGYISLKLGNLEKSVNVRGHDAISAAGNILKYYTWNSGGWDEFDHYLLSGYVVEDDSKSWIKLTPSTDIIRNDSDNIMVDNGKIHIHVLQNTTSSVRRGTVYMTAIKNPEYDPGNGYLTSYRIKIDIMQLAP